MNPILACPPARRAGMSRRSFLEVGGLAVGLFAQLVIVQGIAAALVTPAVVAGAVAEEKERGTLEYLLTSDLGGREVALGKFAARVLELLTLLLAGLPLFAVMQLYGGVEARFVGATAAALAAGVAALAAAALLASVLTRRARDAVILTYLLTAVYFAAAGAAHALSPGTGNRTGGLMVPTRAGARWVVAPSRPLSGLADALPVRIAAEFLWGSDFGTFPPDLPDRLWRSAALHGLVALGLLTLAGGLLRPVAKRQLYGTARTARRRARPIRLHGLLDRVPAFWKELLYEGRGRSKIVTAIGVAVTLATLAPVLFDGLDHPKWRPGEPRPWLAKALHNSFGVEAFDLRAWVRALTAGVGTLALLAVALRAAASVGGERDRQTLTCLLGTGLTEREVVRGKWLGAVLGPRGPLLWLALVCLVGVWVGGMPWWAVVPLALAWLVYAGLAAGIGLYCSAACPTTRQANQAAFVFAVFLAGAHWVVPWLLREALRFTGTWYLIGRPLNAFWSGLTPPAVLGELADPASALAATNSGFFFTGLFGGLAAAAYGTRATLRAAERHFARGLRPNDGGDAKAGSVGAK